MNRSRRHDRITPPSQADGSNRGPRDIGHWYGSAALFQLAGKFSRPSADMCLRLESASEGRMTREDLRPDLFLRQSA